jgi:RNA polymerase sigma factor (sigma-70 family)
VTPDQFAEQYKANLPRIAAFIARRVDRSLVEDLCSDVFEIAYRKRNQAPQETDREFGWLCQIAQNLINNHRRREVTSKKLVVALSVPTSSPSAESLVVQDLHLRECWNQLKPKQQQILAMVAFDEMSIKDVAMVLGIKPNAATVRLSRAREAFAKLLESKN